MIPQKTIKRLFSLSILTLLVSPIFAQVNFIKGYIINNNGDTLHGYIDYRNWGITPKSILFKNDLASNNVVSLNPVSIKGFGVPDDTYESALIRTEQNINYEYKVNSDEENIYKADSVFLQAIVKGKKALYYHKNSDQLILFFIKHDSIYDLLRYKKVVNAAQGGYSYVEKKPFLAQLQWYLSDCPKITSQIKYAKYNQNSLEKLFVEYYKCHNDFNTITSKNNRKVTIERNVLIGASMSTINFNGGIYPWVSEAKYKNSLTPTVALNLDIIFPRNQGRWSFCNEIMYQYFKISGEFEDDYFNYDLTFNYSYLKLNSLLRFKYPIGKLFIFCNAGISLGKVLDSEAKSKRVSSLQPTTISNPLEKEKATEFGPIFGAGAKYNRYSCEIRYELGNGISSLESSSLVSKTTRYYVLLGYKF